MALNLAGCLDWNSRERRFVNAANVISNAHTRHLYSYLLASDEKILVFKETFRFSGNFFDCVFSLRSWDIIFLGVGKVLCFCGAKNAVLVFCREGPELAGIRETFSNGGRGEHDGCVLQYERAVQTRIISCHVPRHADGSVKAKHPGCHVREIFQAGDLMVCDGRPQAGGECAVDFGAETGLDVSLS